MVKMITSKNLPPHHFHPIRYKKSVILILLCILLSGIIVGCQSTEPAFENHQDSEPSYEEGVSSSSLLDSVGSSDLVVDSDDIDEWNRSKSDRKSLSGRCHNAVGRPLFKPRG